ncbi:MAG: ABC transporter permease [Xanthomonadales bacterium]|nr:Oligopeptide transport system permease protein OppB [Xanthomonadales bacterium]MCC6593943.1 ABC transporter permease [Xanthomonadales bacterium]
MSLLRLLALRLATTAATLVLLAVTCLALLRAVPGGPFDQEKLAPPEVQAALAARYRLDQPFWVQAGDYLGGALRGDLGPSFQYADYSVTELLAAALPITLWLGGLAALLALALATAIGGLAAGWPGGPRLASLAGLLALAMPKFVLAPLLVLLFALSLRWLPSAGFGWDTPATWVLPVLSLALPQAALLLRVLVENLQAALASPPCIAALARGYGRARVVWRHALPLAAAQSLGFLGPVLVALLTGSAIVETVFAIPGLGRTLVGAALNRDYTLLLGAVLCVALIVAAINLVVDLLQWGLDPRVRG